jgi:hypothetical protein
MAGEVHWVWQRQFCGHLADHLSIVQLSRWVGAEDQPAGDV